MSDKVGIYLHIPFCAQKCPYCDFYSQKYSGEFAEQYVNALVEHMRQYKGVKADTIYFGGGTPSLIKPEFIARLIDIAVENFSLSGEVTIEANPNTLNKSKLEQYKLAGVNRISMGMQSANVQELNALGRTHSNEQVCNAVEISVSTGINNISIDLMLGTPYQTIETLDETLAQINALPITHVSAYMLKVEKHTPFYNSKLLDYCADDDLTADMYLHTVNALALQGFKQYEISNFCKDNKKSLHNMKYWQCNDYLGFGASAHSCFNGERFSYESDITDYIKTKTKQYDKVEPLFEYIMLGLRLNEGISLKKIMPAMDSRRLEVRLSRFIGGGLMRQFGDRIMLTPEGFLLSNTIIGEVAACIKNKSYNL